MEIVDRIFYYLEKRYYFIWVVIGVGKIEMFYLILVKMLKVGGRVVICIL